MRKLLFFLALSLLPQVAEAEPKERLAHLFVDIVLPAGTSLAATHFIHTCRQQFGVGGHCPDGGYGEFKAREGLQFGFSVGMGQLGRWWRNSEDDRTHWDWLLPSVSVSTYNTIQAIEAATHGGSHEKVDLSRITFIRH